MTRRARSTPNPKTAVAYLRVSTEDQRLGPKAQRDSIERWAAHRGITIAAWHVDDDHSGALPIDKRPGLVAALAALREHGAGVLVAAKRDRFARDRVIAVMVERAAKAAGATALTADGASDTTGPEGVMMRGIVDVFSEYERGLIRARTTAALAAKKARGELVGKAPFGFRVAADGVHLEADADEQAVLAAVRQLSAAGLSLRGIVAALARRGLKSRAGKPLALTQVARIVRAA